MVSVKIRGKSEKEEQASRRKIRLFLSEKQNKAVVAKARKIKTTLVELTLTSLFWGCAGGYGEENFDLPRPYPQESFQTQHILPSTTRGGCSGKLSHQCLCSSEVMELIRGFSVLVGSRAGLPLTREVMNTVTFCSTVVRVVVWR